jgi:hypothetical protein
MTRSYAPSPYVMAAHYRSPTPVGNAGYAWFGLPNWAAITPVFQFAV